MTRLRHAWGWRRGLPIAFLGIARLWGGPWSVQPLAAQQGVPSAIQPGPALAFRNVTVIDVTTGQRRANQTVVIVGTRIQAVGPTRATPVPPGATVVDAHGKYLIPGLWDMHAHVGRLDSQHRMVRAGITGFRNPAYNVAYGYHLERGVRDRQAIRDGKAVGPPRQILGAIGVASEVDPTLRGSDGTPTLFDMAAFDSLKRAGADMFKVLQMPRAKYFQFARQARRVGLTFGGHIGPFGGRFGPEPTNPDSSSVTAEEISDSGASIIDHIGLDLSGGLDTLCVRNPQRPEYQRVSLAACRRAAEHLRRNGTWWVPTLSELLIVPRGQLFDVRPRSKELELRVTQDSTHRVCDATVRSDSSGLLGLAYRAGMPLLAGTDVGGIGGDPAFLLHHELALMVSEGLPPLAALQAATLNPAKFLHATDSLGTVAPGKVADLVLLDDNPLVNITNTTHVRAVVANGRYLEGERPCH